ncbi:MAG: phosphoribosylformylglycinamidine synthase subunit PurL, partial [Melioribacteraceae bacterium]|nr:phosphoribosylformylglycinamidine synthase subunit PurL [Melioribacteraceae bacterium]
AVTNCLNFGNPYKPEMYWNFKKVIEGMGEACRYFNTPVTGGNVSFYNESPDTAVYPTPVIGMIGLIEELEDITTANFKANNDLIYLLGEDHEELGGSEYMKVIHNVVAGDSPKLDLQREKDLHHTLLELIRNGFIKSAHDVSEGGIITALAECCILDKENPIGAEVNIPIKKRTDFSFFSETQSRVIVSIASEDKRRFEEIASRSFTPFQLIGNTKGKSLHVNDQFEFTLEQLIDIYFNTIDRRMNVTV